MNNLIIWIYRSILNNVVVIEVLWEIWMKDREVHNKMTTTHTRLIFDTARRGQIQVSTEG